MRRGWWKMTTNSAYHQEKKFLNEPPVPSPILAIPEAINDDMSDAECVDQLYFTEYLSVLSPNAGKCRPE